MPPAVSQALREYAAAYRFLNVVLRQRIPAHLDDPFFPFFYISLNGELELKSGVVSSNDPAYFTDDWAHAHAQAGGDGEGRAYATLLRFIGNFVARGSTPNFDTFAEGLLAAGDGLPSDAALRSIWAEAWSEASSATDVATLIMLTRSPFVVRDGDR
ncbi:MAG: hypothetical protein JWO85_2793 [Candidatus Eremiobacteraeota bacterium]|jgi:hypothetical protein|nr:hypothetical protein [Candidatus Eremiobacteraeota bacterium]